MTKSQLLILDLDETLIHAREKLLNRKCDFEIDGYYVYQRPYLDDFILECYKLFELAVWTTAGRIYADEIVENIFPSEVQLSFVWSIDRCTYSFDSEDQNHYWMKNLKKLRKKGYRLEKVLMVDDTPEKLKKNYGNLIQIAPYFGNNEDRELQILLRYLKTLVDVPNVRTIEKRYWKTHFAIGSQ